MTRTGILAAARHVCETHGVASLTMRRIAAEAGITAPAIYRHFPGKAELLDGLVEQANERLAAYLARAGAPSDPIVRLRRTFDAIVDLAIQDPTSYDVLFFSRDRRDAGLEPERLGSPNFRTVVRRVEACQRAGRLRRDRDAVSIAIAMWAQVHGLIALHVQGRFGRSPVRLRKVVRRSMAMLLDGIVTKEGRRA